MIIEQTNLSILLILKQSYRNHNIEHTKKTLTNNSFDQ